MHRFKCYLIVATIAMLCSSTAFSTYTGKHPFTWIQEVVSGSVNSSNTVFTLSHSPTTNASVHCHTDGLTQQQTADITVSGITVTFGVAPITGSIVYCDYVY